MIIPTAYIAHRYGNGTHQVQNWAEAINWYCWLADRYLIEPIAPWIILTMRWTDKRRELGMKINEHALSRCTHFIACGNLPGLSEGMEREANMFKRPIINITGIPYDVADTMPQEKVDNIILNTGICLR